MGGPGAIFWMWVSAMVGMSTKFHEATLAIMYKGRDNEGRPKGGMMYIIEQGLGSKWKPLARTFAIAGLFGTMCIINANQLTEAVTSMCNMSDSFTAKLIFGILMASVVALVVLRGVTRIANVASILVPFMVGIYFLMVLYIIVTHIADVPRVVQSIFVEAFNLKAGIGALVGIALIGARRAALVNDAGIGTASIMHGASRNTNAVREGLVAMLGPAIDSGFVCTLTALALMLCGDFVNVQGVKGLEAALQAFDSAIPGGAYLLMVVVTCFAMSSMFSYSYYGTSCATYLFGEKKARYYTVAYILSLVFFAVVPLEAAVSMCDLFYACMAFPTMITLIMLSKRVREVSKAYFSKDNTDR
jgi:AGCS family alanine or glycine:cation symporter